MEVKLGKFFYTRFGDSADLIAKAYILGNETVYMIARTKRLWFKVRAEYEREKFYHCIYCMGADSCLWSSTYHLQKFKNFVQHMRFFPMSER